MSEEKPWGDETKTLLEMWFHPPTVFFRSLAVPDGQTDDGLRFKELERRFRIIEVFRSGESRRGPMNYTLVFNKQ